MLQMGCGEAIVKKKEKNKTSTITCIQDIPIKMGKFFRYAAVIDGSSLMKKRLRPISIVEAQKATPNTIKIREMKQQYIWPIFHTTLTVLA
jgi:hypothetical protein